MSTIAVTLIALAAFLAGVLVAASRARTRQAQLQAELAAAAAAGEELRAAAERERQVAEERIAEATASREHMLAQFKAASVDALKQNGDTFMQLAKAELEKSQLQAAGELEARRKQIGELVKPIETTLKQVDQRIDTLDKERAKMAVTLTERMRLLAETGDRLREETGTLSRALRQPVGRGQWGERVLQQVVELAGMSQVCQDFTVQHSTHSEEERRLRPDMLVRLPNGRCIVIDAKTPLDAYMDAVEAADDDLALPHLQRHAEQVRTHVRQLASRDYARHVDGAVPDFVVLFLPAEHLFAAAVRMRPDLIDEARAKNVYITSPTTLLALLHVVAEGFNEERLARHAEEIAGLGRELYGRVATMAGHFATLGKRLGSATKAYNETLGSLERNVLSQTRKFEKLGAGAAKEIVEPEAVSEPVRQIAAAELIDALEVEALAVARREEHEQLPVLAMGGSSDDDDTDDERVA